MLHTGEALRKQRPAPGGAQPGTIQSPGCGHSPGDAWLLAPASRRVGPSAGVCKPHRSIQEGRMPPVCSAWLLLGALHHWGRRWALGCLHLGQAPCLRPPDLWPALGGEEAAQPKDLAVRSGCRLPASWQGSEQCPLLLPRWAGSLLALGETGPCCLPEGTRESLLVRAHSLGMGHSGAAGLRLEGPRAWTETFWGCQQTLGISPLPQVQAPLRLLRCQLGPRARSSPFPLAPRVRFRGTAAQTPTR